MSVFVVRAVEGMSYFVRRLLAFIIFSFWISLCVGLFWHFQFKHQQTWVSFRAEQLQQSELVLKTGTWSMVHFVDQRCPCTKFSLPHIAKLAPSFSALDIKQVKVVRGELVDDKLHNLIDLIPASPSVAVWDENGKLKYFGPYSSGAICGEGEDLLSKAIQSDRAVSQWTNQEAVGCYCDWINV